MYKHFIWFTLLIGVCSLAAWASVTPQKGKLKKVEVSKVKEVKEKAKVSSGCTSPRPPNRGCKIACKPCQVATCENGKWVYEKFEWPKEECRPHQGDPGGSVCVVGPTDFCPAECKKCIRR